MEELVVLVNKDDQQIGVEQKLKAHELGKLHRAFSIFIFTGDGKILLQQRALSKYHSPGLWSNTCCGHPRPGESLQDAIHRRLMEEMGIECMMEKAFHFMYKAKFLNGLTEFEYDHVFVGICDGEVACNPAEVMDFEYLTRVNLQLQIKLHPDRFTVWFQKALPGVLKAIETHKLSFGAELAT